MARTNLIIRADATIAIGTGHMMRCLALAQAWQDVGGDCVFVMVDVTPAAEDRIQAEGFSVVRLNAVPGSSEDADQLLQIAHRRNADWLVVDGYHFQTEYQRKLKQGKIRFLYLDDTGECVHYWADLVLNQNAHANENLYQHRESYTRLLLGSRYAMLRREFLHWTKWKREILDVGRKALVTMGGSDPDNFTARVVEALHLVEIERLEAAVIVGGSNPHLNSLKQLVARFDGSVRLHENIGNMAEFMAWADVAVSAAGTTSWEMCLLGLPAILIDLAPNQRPIAEELNRKGCAFYLGSADAVSAASLAAKLEPLLLSPETRRACSQRARELVDGGGARRVVSALRGGVLRVRRAEQKDCRILWEWANDPEVRTAAFSSAPIPWAQHEAWFARLQKDPNCRILIGEDSEGTLIGQFRVNWKSVGEGEIDVSLSRGSRGSGYGGAFIDLAARSIFEEWAGTRLHAFIKSGNQPSRRAFERAGFTSLGEENVDGHATVHYVLTREADAIMRNKN